MANWLAVLLSLLALGSTALCLFLWFREVRRIMRERKSTVDSAGIQLSVYTEKSLGAHGDPEAAAVLARSERIYHQAVEIYNQTLERPWNYLPAHLMGFHRIP